MNTCFRRLALLGLTCLMPALAGAADTGPQVAAEFRAMSVREPMPGLFIRSGSRFEPVEAVVLGISNTVQRYAGPATMQLFRAGGARGEMQAVGQVSFPSSGRYLVLLSLQPDGKITGMAVADSTATFPTGSIRFLNASGVSLWFTCNSETKVELKPGEAKIVSLSSAAQAEVHVFARTGDAHTEVTNNVFAIGRNSRRTIFFIMVNAGLVKLDPTMTPAIEMFNYSEQPPASRGREGGG